MPSHPRHRATSRAAASSEAVRREQTLLDAAEEVKVDDAASRIAEGNVAAGDGRSRIASQSETVGSEARAGRLEASMARRGKGGRSKSRLKRARRRVRHASASARRVSQEVDEAVRTEGDPVQDAVDRFEHTSESVGRPVGKGLRRTGRAAAHGARRAMAARLRRRGRTDSPDREAPAEDVGVPSERQAYETKADGTVTRGLSARVSKGEAARAGATQAERLRKAQATTSRALGSSVATAASSGRIELVPSTLRGMARQYAGKVAAGATSIMSKAASAILATAALVLPAALPALMCAIIFVSVVMSLLSAAAGNLTGISGGEAVARVANAEYEAGAARGDYNIGGGKYRSWAGVDADWCAVFVCWCEDQCGFIDQGIVPKQWYAGFDAYYAPKGTGEYPGRTIYGAANYDPQLGDIFIYGGNAPGNVGRGAGYGDHVALVTQIDADGSFWTVEGNTSGPGSGGSWSSRVVNKKRHERVDGGWTGTMWAGDFCVVRPAYPTMEGQVIEIPEPYGNGGYTVTEYDLWFEDWAGGTNQRQVADEWASKGRKWKDDIASIDGRYLVACTTTYGTVGDRLTFYLSDGTAIPCIMADAKSMSDPGCNMWGHADGQNVLEFEVRSARFRSDGNPGSASWMPSWAGKRVVRCVNESRAALGVSSEGALAAVEYAKTMLGKPYVTDAESPSVGFDCSGLVYWAYQQAGITIPRGQRLANGYDDSMVGWVREKGGWTTDQSQLKAGDLLFWGSDWTNTGHVALCIGNGQIIHADGYSVSIASVYYSSGSFVGGGPIV